VAATTAAASGEAPYVDYAVVAAVAVAAAIVARAPEARGRIGSRALSTRLKRCGDI